MHALGAVLCAGLDGFHAGLHASESDDRLNANRVDAAFLASQFDEFAFHLGFLERFVLPDGRTHEAKAVNGREARVEGTLVVRVAREMQVLCDSHDALFIMNDDADVARAVEAHGLHVGQTDLPVGEARKSLSLQQIVGRSNNGVEQAMDSQQQGADYLAVGAVYATATMGKSGRTAVGPETIRKVKEMVDYPIVAIGGIDHSNIAEVARAGADCICVVSAVTFADDPEAAAARLVQLIESA